MKPCIGCGFKHYPHEPHVPGVTLYDPWSDPNVNPDVRNR